MVKKEKLRNGEIDEQRDIEMEKQINEWRNKELGPMLQNLKDSHNKLQCLLLVSFFPVQSNKHSSLVRKSVNHGQKKFYNIGPSWRNGEIMRWRD